MRIYNVLEPPLETGSAKPDPVSYAFVKEGFSWPALFLGPFWVLWKRMWLVFLAYLAAALSIGVLADALPEAISFVPPTLFILLFALEANNLRCWTLERRGYRLVDVSFGDSISEAELRFFSRETTAAPATPPPAEPKKAPPPFTPPPAPPEAVEIVGLFPRPGGGMP